MILEIIGLMLYWFISWGILYYCLVVRPPRGGAPVEPARSRYVPPEEDEVKGVGVQFLGDLYLEELMIEVSDDAEQEEEGQ